MEKERVVEKVKHPVIGGNEIEGTRLEPGDTIEKDDIYSDSSGTWSAAHNLSGIVIKVGWHTTWVRPVAKKKVQRP